MGRIVRNRINAEEVKMWATGQGETATEMGGLCKEGSSTARGG